MALLPAKAFGFGDGKALDSDFVERKFHRVKLERLYDRFDFLHEIFSNDGKGTRSASPIRRSSFWRLGGAGHRWRSHKLLSAEVGAPTHRLGHSWQRGPSALGDKARSIPAIELGQRSELDGVRWVALELSDTKHRGQVCACAIGGLPCHCRGSASSYPAAPGKTNDHRCHDA